MHLSVSVEAPGVLPPALLEDEHLCILELLLHSNGRRLSQGKHAASIPSPSQLAVYTAS